MGDLTEHFSRSEFACSHCGREPEALNWDLVNGLEAVRATLSELMGRSTAVRVVSGWRCPEHVLSIKRERNGQRPSQHTLERAADVATEAPLVALAAAALGVFELATGGVGIYPSDGFLHVDVREDGPTRWGRLQGEYVAWRTALVEVLGRG